MIQAHISYCRWLEDKKYEWHHIIPQERKNHPLVIAAIQCRFKFNSDDNLIKLENYVKYTVLGRHGSHRNYNDWVNQILDNELDEFRLDKGRDPDYCEAKDLVLKVVNYLKNIIEVVDQYLKINDIGQKYLEE